MKKDKEITFKITTEQKKHLKSIQWLLGDKRGSGRTELLAYIYIIKALEGKRVRMIDHAFITSDGGYKANKMLADYVTHFITENELPLKIEWSTLILSINK